MSARPARAGAGTFAKLGPRQRRGVVFPTFCRRPTFVHRLSPTFDHSFARIAWTRIFSLDCRPASAAIRSSASSRAAGWRACSSPTRPRSAAPSSSRCCRPSSRRGSRAERFAREIRLVASLQQANIVPVLTSGETNGLPYYTMPFVEGSRCGTRLDRGGRLAIAEAVGDAARRRARARVRARARRRAPRHQARQHPAVGRRGRRRRLRDREGDQRRQRHR